MTPVIPGAPTPGQPARMSLICSHDPQLCFLLLPSLTRNYLTAHMRHVRPHLYPKAKHELPCPRQAYRVWLRPTGTLRSRPSPCRLPTLATCTPTPGPIGLLYRADWATQPNCGALTGPSRHPCAIYGRVCMWIGRVLCACAELSSSIDTFLIVMLLHPLYHSSLFPRLALAPREGIRSDTESTFRKFHTHTLSSHCPDNKTSYKLVNGRRSDNH